MKEMFDMIPNPRPPTARIYQFPVKPRAPAPAPRTQHAQMLTACVASPPRTECGSGWYHDAAISDTDQGHKH